MYYGAVEYNITLSNSSFQVSWIQTFSFFNISMLCEFKGKKQNINIDYTPIYP